VRIDLLILKIDMDSRNYSLMRSRVPVSENTTRFPLVKIYFLLAMLCTGMLQAQEDSIPYNSAYRFKDGIYLNYDAFRHDNPVPKSAIISTYNREEIDFMRKTVSAKTISFKDTSGMIHEVNPGKIWGFCENNSVYIRFNNDFNKIVVMGNICHFTAMYTTYLSGGPTTPGGASTGAPVESMQQYVLDTETGRVRDFVLSTMEDIFKRDDALYKEFMALKKNKRRKMMFFYLRKYNEKHPLYIKTW
jgi:hypothetical protein